MRQLLPLLLLRAECINLSMKTVGKPTVFCILKIFLKKQNLWLTNKTSYGNIIKSQMRMCWNRQTGTFEGRVSNDVWVQVPLSAPEKKQPLSNGQRLFLFNYIRPCGRDKSHWCVMKSLRDEIRLRREISAISLKRALFYYMQACISSP